MALRGALIASFLAAATARAEGVHEAVIVRSTSDASAQAGTEELLARVTGELAAAGFRVSVRPLAGAHTAEARDLTLGPGQEAAVVLAEPLRSAGEPLGCLLIDTLQGAPTLTELHVAPGLDAPHRLALHVADVLRGKLAERALHEEPEAPAPEPPPAPEAPTDTPRPPAPPWSASLELGPRALIRPGDWDTTPAPALALYVGATKQKGPALGARITLAGYGGDVRRRGEAGSLTARQGLGLLSAVLAYRGLGPVTPELDLGIGAYGVGVRGASDDPARARARVVLLPALAAGVGAAFAATERVALVVHGQLCFGLRKLSLRIDDAEVARTGGLMLGASALVRVTLR